MYSQVIDLDPTTFETFILKVDCDKVRILLKPNLKKDRKQTILCEQRFLLHVQQSGQVRTAHNQETEYTGLLYKGINFDQA